MRTTALVCLLLVATAMADLSTSDILRAYSTSPRPSLTADSSNKVPHMLNQHLLENYPDLDTRSCDLFTIEELNALTVSLFEHFSTDLQEIYLETGDSRSLRFESLAELEASFESELNSVAADDEELLSLIRNGKCSELVKFWIHHIPETVREQIQHSVVMPLLPVTEHSAETFTKSEEHTETYAKQTDCRFGHAGFAHDACTEAVASRCYSTQHSSCVSCATKLVSQLSSSCPGGVADITRACYQPNPSNDHAVKVEPKNDAPEWPEEVTYNAKGFGKYPFWVFGNSASDIVKGTDIKTHWSAKKNAELLEHASCALSQVGYKDGVACNHLFVGSYSWLYSTDGHFCCQSGKQYNSTSVSTEALDEAMKARPPPPGPNGPRQTLTAPQRDWMSSMTYHGTAQLTTPFYSGTIKNYTYDCSNKCGGGSFYFWYYTDLNGNPIEQGEGCQVMPRTANCRGAVYLWHDYNPSTFKEASYDWSVFDVPQVCQTTSKSCLLP